MIKTHNTNPFQCKDGSAKEEWPFVPIRNVRYRFCGWHILKHVPKCNGHANTNQKVCNH